MDKKTSEAFKVIVEQIKKEGIPDSFFKELKKIEIKRDEQDRKIEKSMQMSYERLNEPFTL